MKQIINQALNKLTILFINWIFYRLLKTPLNTAQLAIITFIAFATYFFIIIISVNKINIANYWSFAKKHPRIYECISLMVILALLFKLEFFNQHAIGLFIILNTILILLNMIETESENI